MLPYSVPKQIAYQIDPVRWVEDEFKFYPDEWQKRLLRSTSRNCCVSSGRQCGKTTIAQFVAAHQVLFNPGTLTVVISPSQRQSSEMGKRIFETLKQVDIRGKLPTDNKSSIELPSKARVVALPASPSNVRGLSADLLLIDESAYVDDDVFVAVGPMLAAIENSRQIWISTPNGRIGRHADVALGDQPEWERYFIKASECPRISPEFLEQQRGIMTRQAFATEYEISFEESGARAFDFDDIRGCFGHERPAFYGEDTTDDNEVVERRRAFA